MQMRLKGEVKIDIRLTSDFLEIPGELWCSLLASKREMENVSRKGNNLGYSLCGCDDGGERDLGKFIQVNLWLGSEFLASVQLWAINWRPR